MFFNSQVSLAPGVDLNIPSDCSDLEIKAFWDQIFIEPSDNVIITSNSLYDGVAWNVCPTFFAYKNDSNRINILIGDLTTTSRFQFTALVANVTVEYLDGINLQGQIFYESENPPGFYLINDTFLIADSTVSSDELADELYNASLKEFKVGDWIPISGSGGSYYFFKINQTSFNGNLNFSGNGGVSREYSYLFLDPPVSLTDEGDGISGCGSPKFEQVNTSCVDDTLTSWFNDVNGCSNTLIYPLNFTSSCDDGIEPIDNGTIIGNISLFIENNPNISIYVDSDPLNISEIIFEEEKEIEFQYDDEVIVTFDYNFTLEEDIDIDGIEIMKQNSSDNLGYVIFNGIDFSKIFRVDRISNGDSVCIRDDVVSDISDISVNCTSIEETLVSCPGNVDGFDCAILGNKFYVSGLNHSGAIEFVTVVNNNTLTNTTNTTTPAPPSCVPDWDCTTWDDKDEDGGCGVRTCNDLNDCNVDTGKPSESITCEGGSIWFVILVVLLIIVILAIMIAISYKVYRDGKVDDSPSPKLISNANLKNNKI